MDAFHCNTSRQTNTPTLQSIITTAQAAAILGVTPSTINRRVARGDLATLGRLSPSGAWLFDMDTIAAIQAERDAEHRRIVESIRAAKAATK